MPQNMYDKFLQNIISRIPIIYIYYDADTSKYHAATSKYHAATIDANKSLK